MQSAGCLNIVRNQLENVGGKESVPIGPQYVWMFTSLFAAAMVTLIQMSVMQQRQEYRDYFFGNMDPSRLVIQKDIDLPLVPTAAGVLLLPMAFQDAAAICDTSDELPGLLVSDGWKWEVKPLVR